VVKTDWFVGGLLCCVIYCTCVFRSRIGNVLGGKGYWKGEIGADSWFVSRVSLSVLSCGLNSEIRRVMVCDGEWKDERKSGDG